MLALRVLIVTRAQAQEPVPSADATAPPETPDASPEPTPAATAAPPAPETTAPVPKARSIDVTMGTQIGGYMDSDHVYVLSPTISATLTNPIAGWAVDGRYLVDIVSAASVDIVSTASRRWEEVRHVGSLGGLYKPGDWGIGGNADVSIEPDYQSYTFSGSVQRDLFQKNLTALLAYEYGHDIAGRGTTPFSVFSRKIDHHAIKGGLTFVLDRSTIFSAVGDVILENGDTSKPYRYVPMFAPGVEVDKGASVSIVDNLRTSARVLEQLPTSRERYALSGHIAHRFTTSTLRADERLYTDSWGLHASTTDVRLILDLSERFDIGPHLRFHIQSPVVFWERSYTVSPNFDIPALRTGDRELGPLYSATFGGAFHWGLGSRAEPRSWTLGLEVSGIETQYLDDLYIKSRLAGIGVLSLEAAF